MCENFFENMHRMLVFIRSDIYNSNNIKFIKILISSIDKEVNNSEMTESFICISSELKQQLLLQDGKMYKVTKEAKDFALTALYIVYKELEEKNYDFAYDVVDMLHVFPHVIIINDKRQIKSYWKIYVRPIMKRRNIKRGVFKAFKEGRL